MDYTFVSQFSADGPKRRRLAKACDICRARKKRCVHFATDLTDNQDHTESSSRHGRSSTEGGSSPAVPGGLQLQGSITNHAPIANGLAHGKKNLPRRSSLSALMNSTAHRFISDLHPEASFLKRNPTNSAHPQSKSTSNMGVWVDKREWEDLIRQRDCTTTGMTSDTLSQSSVDATRTLPKLRFAQTAALLDIYFQKINPILPIVDEQEFRQAHANSILPEHFVLAFCLVAAKDHSAEEHLYLGEPANAMQPRDFCKCLYNSVKSGMASHRYDKITLIRMHALLSLHDEGPEGAEDASLSVSHAMHHCQTLGLHLGQQASLPSKNSVIMKRLFWCVWTLDRFNSAMHGRPIIMADRDIAIESYADGESGYPAFEIMFRVAHVINEVIGFFRPGNAPTVTGWESAYPSFEEIVNDANGWDLSFTTLSTLHIAYLATTILSHRSAPPDDLPNKTPSQVRQNMAAVQIIRLMRPERLKGLHALPVLPYAISLTLSVSYKVFRQSRLRHIQEDGRADFEACCGILQELKRTWSSVDVMATLAQKVSDELKRAPDQSTSRTQRPPRDQRVLEGFATACRDHHEPVVNGKSNVEAAAEGPLPLGLESIPSGDMQHDTVADDTLESQDIGQDLFEGMDDIFGTYLDPNYPINLDDLSFLDDLGAVDWAAQGPNG